MKEFMLIFRSTPVDDYNPSPEEMQGVVKQWQDWIGGIAAQGKFVSTTRLGFEGKTLKPENVITDGPYAEVKEIIGGNLVLKADNIDQALELAKGCPVLNIGGHVEIRNLMEINL